MFRNIKISPTPHSVLRKSPSAVAIAMLFTLLFTQSTPLFAAPRKIRTIVLSLKTRRGADAELALILTDIIQGEVTMKSRRKVFSRADIERLMQFENEKAALGCDDNSCLAELASALDVDRVITGSISKVGSKVYVVLSEFDSVNVEPVARVQANLPRDEDALVEGVQILAQKLLKKSRQHTQEAYRAAQKKRARKNQKKAPTKAKDSATETRLERKNQANHKATKNAVTNQEKTKTIADKIPAKKGALLLNSSPPSRVKIDGEAYGKTPLRVLLTEGDYTVVFMRKKKPDVEFDVEVLEKEKTQVFARLDLKGGIPSQQFEHYQQKKSAQSSSGWLKLAGGGALCFSGCALTTLSLGAITADNKNIGTPVASTAGVTAGIIGLLGVGTCAWGSLDLFFPPRKPEKSQHLHDIKIQTEGEGLERFTVGDGEMAH